MSEFDELLMKLARGAKTRMAGFLREMIHEEFRAAGIAAALAAGIPAVGGGGDRFDAMVEHDSVGVITPAKLGLGGYFLARAENPDGSFDKDSLRVAVAKNMVTNAALNDVLAVYLNSGTQKTNWYLGLIDNSGFSALAAGDTISSHAGWTENTAYSQSTRPQWNPDAPSGQTITNSTSVTFTANASVTIKGCFLVSDNTKGGTTGLLFATGAFTSTQSLVNAQNLKVTYTCPASAT
jgi:hypothetical protein